MSDSFSMTAGSSEQYEVFSFWVDQSLFAVPVSSVLSICKDEAEITKLPTKKTGLLGMIRYLDVVVPVFDFAEMLGIRPGEEVYREYADHLSEFCKEQDSAFLEDSDRAQEEFENRCKKLKAYFASKNFCNERITELVNSLVESLDEALSMEGEAENVWRSLSLKLEQATEDLRELAHSVLLYLTADGNAPSIALRIDEVNNILSYSSSEFSTADNLLGGCEELKDLVDGFLCREGSTNCLLLRPEALSMPKEEYASSGASF